MYIQSKTNLKQHEIHIYSREIHLDIFSEHLGYLIRESLVDFVREPL